MIQYDTQIIDLVGLKIKTKRDYIFGTSHRWLDLSPFAKDQTISIQKEF